MTPLEFQSKIVGVPYVNRGYSFGGCDCWGLCYLYYKHVKGMDLDLSAEYLGYHDFAEAFLMQVKGFEQVERPKEGDCVFVCFNGDVPMHCGIMISRNQVLHAVGEESQCMAWNLVCLIRYLRRFHKMTEEPRVEFYRPCQS